jgi:hypothetical protein
VAATAAALAGFIDESSPAAKTNTITRGLKKLAKKCDLTAVAPGYYGCLSQMI